MVAQKSDEVRKRLVFVLKIFHQHVPDSNDMTDAAGKDKEVEHAVHVFLLVYAIENSSCDIAYSFSDDPYYCCCAHAV